MLRNLIMLPDGTEVFSGGEGAAVMRLELTQSVNESEEMTLGSVCPAMLECRLAEASGVRVCPGDELTLYTVDDDGTRHKMGRFIAEKPVRSGVHTLRLTAYDRLSLLDRDLTAWLSGLEGWPYTLRDFAALVCRACGLTLVGEQIPNGGYPVRKFSADGVTGRQLMRWIGEAAGRFCRANADGDVELAWYAPAPIALGPAPVYAAQADFIDGELILRAEDAVVSDAVSVESPYLQLSDDGAGNVTLTLWGDVLRQYYFQGGLELSDYTAAPIEKVQIRQDEADVGTVYPDIPDRVNTYSITGNPLLTAGSAGELLPVARTLYEQLAALSYTPCTVTCPAGLTLQAGDTVQLTDQSGKTVTVCIMSRFRSGQRDTLECTGSARRDSSTAVNNQSVAALSGKVLRLRTDAEGLKAENADMSGRMSRLELDLEGVRTEVSSQSADVSGVRQQISALRQTADSVQLSLEKIRTDGTTKIKTGMGYTFDDNGLHIAREGKQMENLLDERGMLVTRSGQTILQANDEGVAAADVKVRNYLVVGTHARFEDYGAGRTACFWLEG